MIISKKPRRVLSVFTLVMINVIAVDSLRSLPISAEYGFSILFFYIVGALSFFIPVAMVAAELATAWPENGGLYVWVREAFGKRWGLVTIWLQWIYNIVWYPTILAFLASTFIYLLNPGLIDEKPLILIIILSMFWTATILNCLGMRVSGAISTIGAILGTIIPMLMIIGLGIAWVFMGKPLQIQFTLHNFLPSLSNWQNIAFLTAILFGLIGMEMSAVHAEEVKNPQRDYPRALLYSTIIIFVTLVCSSLAIAIVVPHDSLSLVSGLIKAFGIFFNTFNMSWMIPVIAILIIIGGLSGVSAWVIGPTKGMMIAARDGCLPEALMRINGKNAPIAILLLQGLIFTLLCTVFLMTPNVNSSYWLLSDLTAQLALIVYLFMFAAVIRLRYKYPDKKRSYKIPGGNITLWLIAGTGFITCIAATIIGFFPPSDVNVGNIFFFETFLVLGIVVFCVAPLLIYKSCNSNNH